MTRFNRGKYQRSGFTIVELLIVIVVIGILAAITIVAYGGIQQKAHIAALQSDLKNAANSIEIARITNNNYPADLAAANLKASAGTTYTYSTITASNYYCLAAKNSGITYNISSMAGQSSQGDCPNISGLIGWWPFDGNAIDQSGNNNDGAVNGAVLAAGQSGQANGAYQLGETNQWINIGTPATFANITTTGFTYSVWLTRTGTTVNHWPGVMGSSNTHVSFGIRSGNFGDSIYFEYGTSPYSGSTWTSVGGSGLLPIGEWHLVTATYDGSAVRWYWDGALKSTSTGTLYPTVGQLLFSTPTNGWAGIIDDARIYNHALATAEVQALYAGDAQ